MSVIKLEKVSKVFGFGEAATIAIDNIDLTVEKGEFVAVMGPSGSGKSTMLNIIGMLDRPSHGLYVLNDKNVSRLGSMKRAKSRRDHIGFIFQSFNLLPKMNVMENVALPLAYRGVSSTRRNKRATDMLEKVGLSLKEFYYPRQLSGGQAQRVAIARALINRPSIVIADEPTGNLDSASSRQIMELLGDIHRGGNTIMMVTHNVELTVYADRIIYLKDGRIEYDEKLAKGEKVDLSQIEAAEEYREEVEANIVKTAKKTTKTKTKRKKIKKPAKKRAKK